MLSRLFAENYTKLLEISKNISPSNYQDLLHDTFITIERQNINLPSQIDFIKYTTACLNNANKWQRIKHKERNRLDYTPHTYNFIDTVEQDLILNNAENYSEYIKDKFDDYILNDLPFQDELKKYETLIKFAKDNFNKFEFFVFKCYYIEYLRQNQILEIARHQNMMVMNNKTKMRNIITARIIRQTIVNINFHLKFVHGKNINRSKAKK